MRYGPTSTLTYSVTIALLVFPLTKQKWGMRIHTHKTHNYRNLQIKEWRIQKKEQEKLEWIQLRKERRESKPWRRKKLNWRRRGSKAVMRARQRKRRFHAFSVHSIVSDSGIMYPRMQIWRSEWIRLSSTKRPSTTRNRWKKRRICLV